MLAIERRNDILSKLYTDGKVIVSELSKAYDVTEETIRRDLEKLEKEGLAQKTYGGAVRSESFNVDLPYTVRKQANVSGKRYIAERIGALINDGDYIMLDASSTALFLVKNILHKKKITLITNSVEILLEVANKTDWNVLSTGGSLKKDGLSLVGVQAERMINEFHVDIAVCSCKGLDQQIGATDSNERDSQMKKAFLRAAKKKILAVDSSKFDRISFVEIAGLSEINMVVTDSEPSEEWKKTLENRGVELLY